MSDYTDHFGAEHVAGVQYRLTAPRDWRDATLDELRAYIPGDLQGMPDWAVQAMFPLFARKVGWKVLVKTTVFLTSMSESNQTWSVLEDWNSAENIVHTIGGGGSGGGRTTNGQASGGGGGAYSRRSNVSLTPSGSATFRIGPRATVSTSNGGAGADRGRDDHGRGGNRGGLRIGRFGSGRKQAAFGRPFFLDGGRSRPFKQENEK